jgi:hypothetical protein
MIKLGVGVAKLSVCRAVAVVKLGVDVLLGGARRTVGGALGVVRQGEGVGEH